MPNHVVNEIILHGIKLDAARPSILNAEGYIDFSILLPLPLNFWPGGVSIEEEKHFPGNHLDAATKTWSTKWNAYGQDSEHYERIVERAGSAVLTFQTAWNTPRGWICAVFQTLKCDISSAWMSEGGSGGLETYCWAALEKPFERPWKLEKISDEHPEYRRLYALLYGEQPQ